MVFLRNLWAQLRVRLIVIFTAIALITYLFSGLSLYSSLDAQLLEREQEQLFQRANEIERVIETSLAAGQSLESATQGFQLLPTFGYGIRVENINGQVVNEVLPFPLKTELGERMMSKTSDIETVATGQRYLLLSRPLQQEQIMIGNLTLFSSLTSIDDTLVNLYPLLYFALVSSLLAIVGAGAFIGSSISRVFGEIEEVAESIAQGQFDRRVQVRGDDEVGRLALTINDMASQLAALRRSRAQFFSKVSHELRTPLTIIKGFAITLIRREDLDPKMIRQANIINQQTDNLTRLVDDLLDLARVDVKQLSLKCELTDLGEVVESVVDSYQVISSENGQVLRAELDTRELVIMLDAQRIKQVISILLDNAFKYARCGDEIVVTVRRGGESISIRVEDSGPGIPEENLPHVFERFYQVEPTKGGIGLGLSLARELVKAHQGEITAENRSEGGCCFTILFPVEERKNGRLLDTHEPISP